MNEKRFAKLIGRRIASLRETRGITAEKLAYENGISKGYLSKIENGLSAPSLKILLRIAEALGVECWELLKVKS